MLCPECNAKMRGRNVCPKCHYRTMLPISGEVTERRIRSFIRKATRNGAGYTTPNQVYAAYVYSKGGIVNPKITIISLMLTVICIILISMLDYPWPYWCYGVLFGVPLLLGGMLMLLPRSKLPREKFLNYLHAYCAERPQDRVLLEPSLHSPPPEWTEQDIYDYGAKGILVVDQDLLVDFFIRNGFHQDKSIVVVSEKGYPAYIAARCRSLRQECPELPAGWLHSYLPPDEARERLAGIEAAYGPNIVDLGEETAARLAPFWKKIKNDEKIPPDSLGYNRLAGATAGALLAGLAIPAFIALSAGTAGGSALPEDGSTDGSGGFETSDHHASDSDGGFGDDSDGGDGGDFG